MSRTPVVLFLVVAALWGLPYALVSVALDHGTGPLLIAWARVAIGAIILRPIAAHRGRLHAFRDHPWTVVAVAVLDIAVPFTTLTVGEQHGSSSLAGILIATAPLFVGAPAVAFLPTERPSSKSWAGLALGFAGVVGLFGTGLRRRERPGREGAASRRRPGAADVPQHGVGRRRYLRHAGLRKHLRNRAFAIYAAALGVMSTAFAVGFVLLPLLGRTDEPGIAVLGPVFAGAATFCFSLGQPSRAANPTPGVLLELADGSIVNLWTLASEGLV